MSKPRVFGEQVTVSIGDGTSQHYVAEIDSFSAKADHVVKENSSLGESGVGTVQVLDNGGTLSFEAKHSDSLMIGYFITQEAQIRGVGEGKGKLGKSPYVSVDMVITYVDGTSITVKYEGVTLYNDELSAGGRTEEVSERWEGKYKRRIVSASTDGEAGEVATGSGIAGAAMLAIASLNAQEKDNEEINAQKLPKVMTGNGDEIVLG